MQLVFSGSLSMLTQLRLSLAQLIPSLFFIFLIVVIWIYTKNHLPMWFLPKAWMVLGP